MASIRYMGRPAAEVGALEMLRIRAGHEGDTAALVVRGQVDAAGNFRVRIPVVAGLFRGAVIRELSAMGTASLALSALWDDGLILPLAAPGTMSGTPNEAFVGEEDGLSVEPFGPAAVALIACPVRIDVTGATAGGRFVLMAGFR